MDEYKCSKCKRWKTAEDIAVYNRPCVCKVCVQDMDTVDNVLDVIHRDISGYTALNEVNMINVHLVADYFVKHTAFAEMLFRELDWQLHGIPQEDSA